MGSKRIICFEIDDEYMHFDFGRYALMVYYAKQLNFEMAEKLFKATNSKYVNWINEQWQLPIELFNNIEYQYDKDNDEANFDVKEIIQVISFLDKELIPALEMEGKTDIIDLYGGAENFVTLYYTNPGYIEFIGFTEDEYFAGSGLEFAHFLKSFREILEYSVSVNKPYKVYID